jgi:hypothetical protein
MTEDPISDPGMEALSRATNMLLLDAALGLLLPGLALILAPQLLLVGPYPAATAAILIAELFILSVHLGQQDSPAYRRLAPLLIGPLALAPLLLIGLALRITLPVGLLALLPAAVFARSAHHAWRHLR